MICYVAGPYKAPTAWEREGNIRAAEIVSIELMRLGHAVICPHTMGRFWFGAVPEENVMKVCFELVRTSDVVVLCQPFDLCLESDGTVKELGLANDLGKPVFACIRDLSRERRMFYSMDTGWRVPK